MINEWGARARFAHLFVFFVCSEKPIHNTESAEMMEGGFVKSPFYRGLPCATLSRSAHVPPT